MEENIFKRFFESFASRTVLALLGLVGTGITVYAFLQEKKVDIRYEVLSNTNVLDFNADISKLEVYYDSTNLKQTKENLRIYTVKIINNGDENIIKEFYDTNEPLGIKISTGKIIEVPQIIQTSNNYIKRNLKVNDYQKDKINFSQVIIESGEYFIVKLLVLHPKGTMPKIISFGKIAGQKSISVVNAIDVKDETSFWSKTYLGNIWVQLLRLISYFIVSVLIILFIVFISEQIDSYRDKKKKLKMIKEFKNLKTYQYTRMDDAIFDRYKSQNFGVFHQMQSLIEDEKNLNTSYNELTEKLKSKEYKRFRNIENTNNVNQKFDTNDFYIINEMMSDGIVFKENDVLIINQAMKDTLNKFISFLKEKGEFKRRYFRSFENSHREEELTDEDNSKE